MRSTLQGMAFKPDYDKKEAFEKEVLPLLLKAFTKCREMDFPFFFVALPAHNTTFPVFNPGPLTRQVEILNMLATLMMPTQSYEEATQKAEEYYTRKAEEYIDEHPIQD